jgi:uncharacterized protein
MIRAPMARPLEDPLDVGPLAAQRAELVREFPVRDFGRLRDGLARADGHATVTLRFHVAGELPAAEGTLTAGVWLVCQRCLAAYEARLESAMRLAFVDDDADADAVPEGYEAVTVAAGRVRLAELVEDELLLSLPLVPVHAQPAECSVQAEVPAGEARPTAQPVPAQRPFAGLQDLLKR